MKNKVQRLTARQTMGFILLSILINATGNGLTVSLNMGSALWTASTVNLSHLLNFDLKPLLVIYGVIVVILNAFLIKRIEPRRIINNFLFMIPFSYLVGWTAELFNLLPLDQLNTATKILLDCCGILMIATGVSIYQRVNILLHPNDDFMQILRFKFFHGNSAIAMWVSFMPPITISLICILITHQIYAINVGTAFSLLFQGSLIGLADRYIFPNLKHQGIESAAD
ncbi:hypothetical protein ACFQ5M_01085 [Agrilactobacillus yilanensis]|uniref:Fructose permease n=1 Tax=Agrilactobacillus yilanensis TaxID=2485997 RepID=A0ABW4J3B5_9LACO|nr:hypothetical protein [Agrilactobacillus yilanensis]